MVRIVTCHGRLEFLKEKQLIKQIQDIVHEYNPLENKDKCLVLSLQEKY